MPVLPELQGLLTKTSGAAAVVRRELALLAPRVAVAVVFGSAASGNLRAASDVDLLVLSDDLGIKDLAGAIRRAGQALGRDVNVNLYRRDEWRRRLREDHPFPRSVLEAPRIVLMGDGRELERVAEDRMAARPRA